MRLRDQGGVPLPSKFPLPVSFSTSWLTLLLFQAESAFATRQWFRTLQFYGLSLGSWRQRRNAMANIMINGMGRKAYD